MKRPVVVVNILSFLLIFLMAQERNMSAVFFVILVTSFFMNKKHYMIILLLFLVFLSFLVIDKKIDYYDRLPNDLEVKGYLSYSQKNDEMILTVVEINDKKSMSYKLLVKNDTGKNFNSSVFKKQLYKVEYTKNDFFKRNPNTFNYKMYLNSNGLVDVVKLSEVKMEKVSHKSAFNIGYFNYKNKNYLKTRIMSLFNNKEESGGFVIAILFGDKAGLSDDTLDVFRKNGTSHVLAISGLHIGLLFGVVYKSLFFIKNENRSLFSIMALFIYIVIIGVPISALRAGFMLIFSLLASKFERKYDMLNVLSLISVIMILINPLIIFNVSYQLSFVAVLVISTFYQVMKSKLNTKKSLFWGILLLPLVIQIGMLPLQIYHFNHISILSFIINIPTILLMSAVLYLSVLLVVTILVVQPLAGVVALLVHSLMNIVKWMNYIYANFEVLNVEVPSPHVSALIFFYISLIALTYKNRKKIITIFFIVLFSCRAVLGVFAVEVYFFDIGQGDSILIKRGLGERILIDGGPSSEDHYLKEVLYKNGVGKLDAIILSHSHSDHIGGIIDISKHIKTDNIFFTKPNGKNVLFENLVMNINRDIFRPVDRGNLVNVGKIDFEIYGVSEGDNLNDNSLVTVGKIFNTRILFTGDIEEKSEKVLIKNNELYDIDIVKVPHHGSDTSSTIEFLDIINPEVAIACVGKNNYGHPDADVINRYLDMGSEFYRTDYGCVKITILPFNIYFIKQYK